MYAYTLSHPDTLETVTVYRRTAGYRYAVWIRYTPAYREHMAKISGVPLPADWTLCRLCTTPALASRSAEIATAAIRRYGNTPRAEFIIAYIGGGRLPLSRPT